LIQNLAGFDGKIVVSQGFVLSTPGELAPPEAQKP